MLHPSAQLDVGIGSPKSECTRVSCSDKSFERGSARRTD